MIFAAGRRDRRDVGHARGISDTADHIGRERIHDRDAVDLSARLEVFG